MGDDIRGDRNVHHDRQQWKVRSGQSADPNFLFFSWYDSQRKKHFGMKGKSLSLEIGPGEGGFARICNVDVLVDVSERALCSFKRIGGPTCVVADASHLTFPDASFAVVYTNDVAHHLKAQGILPLAAREIRRILEPGGVWCVSDRRPSLYNTVTLAISGWGRAAHVALCKVLGKSVSYSGSDDESPMTEADFDLIGQGMVIVSRVCWRNIAIFWVYGFFQFVRMVLPERWTYSLAERLVSLVDTIERHSTEVYTSDVCLTLRKQEPLR
jgi:SAM-dependent methyltransferase